MNWVFFALIAVSVVTAAFNGTMPKLTEATVLSAKQAVELAIALIGQMTLWLGLVGVLREAGLLRSLANALKPVMSRLFPEVPPDHPALGAMILNLAANLLGLGNAATPFGLKAMQELDKLNQRKGVATNSMALFLAINTSAISLPLTVISLRGAAGSKDPAGIIVPTILAASFGTICAVLVCKLLERRAIFSLERYGPVEVDASKLHAPDAAALERAEALAAITVKPVLWRQLVAATIAILVIVALVRHVSSTPATMSAFDVTRGLLSEWLLPLLILGIVTLGFGRQVKVYEAFIAAAKEGFQTVTAIIPFLVGVLVAVGMFRASGAMEVLVSALAPLLSPIGFPPEALPLALVRPLSGSGALGLVSDGLETYGPDSFLGYLLSVMAGSTETTFYVLALYFGAVQVKALRHTLAACVTSDLAGPLGALVVCRVFFT